MNKFCPLLLAIPLAFGISVLRAAPASSAGLDKIAAYAGTWKGRTENLKTPYSKAGKETAEIHNDCWRSGDFYVIHQVVNGKPATVLSVYTYDAKTDAYHVYAVPTDGSDPGPRANLSSRATSGRFHGNTSTRARPHGSGRSTFSPRRRTSNTGRSTPPTEPTGRRLQRVLKPKHIPEAADR